MKKQLYEVFFSCGGDVPRPAVKLRRGGCSSLYVIGPYLGRKEAWSEFRKWRDENRVWVHSDDFSICRVGSGKNIELKK